MPKTESSAYRPNASIAIIGGGIVGAASALALAEEGFRVTVFEPDDIGSGTSSGNAGGIVTGAVMPTATPGVLRAIPGMVFGAHGAAVLRPSYALPVLPWLARFVAAGRASRVKAIAAALHPLVSGSMAAHLALAKTCGAQDRIRGVGWLKVYRTKSGFAATALDRALMQEHGVKFSVLSAHEVADLEPQLDPASYSCGLFQPESGFVNRPLGLSQAYFAGALDRRAEQVRERVVELRPLEGGGVDIITPQSQRRFDAVLVAAGAWSKPFAKQIGDKVCLDAERGYHISLRSTGVDLLHRPVCFPEQHFVLSPMQDGISIVGIDELAGLVAPPDYRRIRSMLPLARKVLPGISKQAVQREWMGFRPSTPDSLPVIGRSPRCKDVFYAFGHGHLGLTLSAITAQWIADLVSGRAARVDMEPYRIDRFSPAFL
jgi:D-amino-acid dehydrogenase